MSSHIADQLTTVRAEIAAACALANRPMDAVRLIAVSKTKPAADVEAAAAAGQLDFGENKVQEMVEKQASLPHLRWHLIGSLQRNKVKYIAPFVALIHSIDSRKLLAEVDLRAAQNGRIIPCLLQINISNEEQKGGMSEQEAEELLLDHAQFPNVRIDGLMGMAEFTEDKEVVSAQFERLAQARRRLVNSSGLELPELSMGMSGDFVEAIAAGATMVRIGSTIFGGR